MFISMYSDSIELLGVSVEHLQIPVFVSVGLYPVHDVASQAIQVHIKYSVSICVCTLGTHCVYASM